MKKKSARPLILLALNEIDFGLAKRYVTPLRLKNIGALLDGKCSITQSESDYAKLEPWIQWVTVHTGLDATQHGVFRLGDIVHSPAPQIFETLEQCGLSVGNICAMNAANRMEKPAYFIPDPWTLTESDGSLWSRKLTIAFRQAVNDNARNRLTLGNMFWLLGGLIRFARPKNYPEYLHLALFSKGKPWRKALFLDLFLSDIHVSLHRRTKPDFASVFFNAGAHIQHHYMFNARHGRSDLPRNPEWYVGANDDPFAEMLRMYDRMLGSLMAHRDCDFIVATGLTQQPYDRIKYYYRLNEHARFLEQAGIRFASVTPRMTRDFLVEFESEASALQAQTDLSAIVAGPERKPLFSEIDNRGNSLFVSLTYPDQISEATEVHIKETSQALLPLVSFVAIKNGMHNSTGYAFFRGSIADTAPPAICELRDLHTTIRKHFERAKAHA
jgi:hypothetical protein